VKYVFNIGIIGALAGLWGTYRQTKSSPFDWRTVLIWVASGISIAVAIGNVALREKDERYTDEKELMERAEKRA